MDYIELEGDENITIYVLYLHGGSCDGTIQNSFKPYSTLRIDKEVYQIRDYDKIEKESDCLVWVSDYTYRIDLYFVGYGKLGDYI